MDIRDIWSDWRDWFTRGVHRACTYNILRSRFPDCHSLCKTGGIQKNPSAKQMWNCTQPAGAAKPSDFAGDLRTHGTHRVGMTPFTPLTLVHEGAKILKECRIWRILSRCMGRMEQHRWLQPISPEELVPSVIILKTTADEKRTVLGNDECLFLAPARL